MAQVLQGMSDSPVESYISNSLNKPTKDARAIDLFLGEDKLESVEYKIEEDEMSTFYPKKLNLFHIALLTYIVHPSILFMPSLWDSVTGSPVRFFSLLKSLIRTFKFHAYLTSPKQYLKAVST